MGKRHSPEQIIRKLRQAEAKLSAGAAVSEVARELGISEATFHRWKNLYGGMSSSEAKTPQGVGEGERSPQEASCRAGPGHRHSQGGEPKKLLSPSRRRRAVEHIRQHWGVSERRACRTVGQPRSTQRYPSRKADWDRSLIERIIKLSKENPRYGYRRAWALLLRREGWHVNKKRIYRLWREGGLQVFPTNSTKEDGFRALLRTVAPVGRRSTRTMFGAMTLSWTARKTVAL